MSEGLQSLWAAASQHCVRHVRGREADGRPCCWRLAQRLLWAKLLGRLGANIAHSCLLLEKKCL